MRHFVSIVCVAMLAACADKPMRTLSHGKVAPPPQAEFLIAAGDSTFWVTTGRDGIRVRGAPLVLARYGGRFYEVYVADDDRSFYNAVFVGQRIFARDLLNGDSVAVFEDSSIGVAASRYATRHPDDAPLGPDDDTAENPTSSVTGEVQIVDLHGPFLSFEYRSSANGEAGIGEDVRHGVLDLRAHGAASLRSMLGEPTAGRVLAEGRRELVAIRDSIKAVRDTDDESVRRAAHALVGGAFLFDPASFTLIDRNQTLAVAFAVPGHGSTGRGRWLGLAPVPVPQVPGWWTDVLPTLPSTDGLWRRSGSPLDVVARYDTADKVVSLALRDGTKEWPLARVPTPAHRVYWLDSPPADSVTRRALTKAFDESALYADDARSVRLVQPSHRSHASSLSLARFRPRPHPRPRRGPDR